MNTDTKKNYPDYSSFNIKPITQTDTAFSEDIKSAQNKVLEHQQDQLDYEKIAKEPLISENNEQEDNGESFLSLTKKYMNPISALVDKTYNAIKEEKITDAWRMANIQGHSVNLSKKLDGLLSTEATWVPQIKLAQDYIDKKLQYLQLQKEPIQSEEQAKNNETLMQELLYELNELEPQVKQIARTNPYLQDIFYETKPGELFKNEDQFGKISDLLKYYTYDWVTEPNLLDFDPGNNFKHMLEYSGEKGLNWFGLGTTHELSDDQINYMWSLKNKDDEKNLTNQYDIINNMLESANYQLKSKNDDIIDKINTIHKGNWLFDPTKLDPEFRHKFETNELSIKDPTTWFYALPHLGSSYTELGAMAAQMTASQLLSLVGKAALTTTTGGTLPLLYAAAEVGINAVTNTYMRQSETASELFDAYSQRVLNEVGDENLPLIVQQSKIALSDLGYDVENMTDFEIFQASLANQIPTSNDVYNSIQKDALNGREMLRMTNDMLSLSDMIEATAFSYGGKYLKNAIGLRKLTGNTNASMLEGYGAQTLKELNEQASGLVDRTLTRITNKAFNNPGNSIVARHTLQGMVDLGKTMTKSYWFERSEEGIQSIVSDRYQKGLYDNKQYSTLDGLFNTLQLGLEANLAYYGLHPDNSLNTDADLINSMKIGGFTGLFMSGVYGSPDIYHNTRQVVTDVNLRGLVADNYAEAEKNSKIQQFLNVGTKKGNFEYVYNTLQALKETKPEGVTDQMIDEDIQLAKKVYQYSNNKSTKDLVKRLTNDNNFKYAEYKPSDFRQLIQTIVLLDDRISEQNQITQNSTSELNKLEQELRNSTDELFNTFLDNQYKNYTISQQNKQNQLQDGEELYTASAEEYKSQVITTLLKLITNQTAQQLQQDLITRKEDLQKLKEDTGLDVNVDGISGIIKHVNNFAKSTRQSIQNLITNARQNNIDGTDEEVLQVLYNEMPIIANDEQLKKAIMAKIVNDGILQDLLQHREAYTTGMYFGDTRAYKPTWDKLTDEIRNKIIQNYIRDSHLSESTIDVDKIAKEYNQKIEDSWKSEDELADQYEVARRRAISVVLNDLRRKENKEKQAEAEKEEQFEDVVNQEQQNATTTATDEIQQEEETAPSKSTVTEIDEVEQSSPTEIDQAVETNEQLEIQELLDKLDQMEDQDLSTQQEQVDDEEQLSYQDALQEEISAIEVTEGISNQQIGNQLEEQTQLEIANNSVEEQDVAIAQIYNDEPTDNVPQDEITELEQQSDDYIEETTESTEDSVEEQKEEKEPAKQQEQPTIPTPEPSTTMEFGQDEEESPSTTEGNNSQVFVDPGLDAVLWDPSGNMDAGNAVVIPDNLLQIQDTFDFSDDPTIIGPAELMNNQADIDKNSKVESKNKQKKRHIQNTFFYPPTAQDIMPLKVAGKELVILTKDGKVANRGSGSQLAENLAVPGWLEQADDVYYVVTSSTNSMNSNEQAIDNLAVHMLIEKDGKVYNASLRAVTQELQNELARLGVLQQDIDNQILNLRTLRSKIIRAYAPQYFTTKQLPTTALKHVKPTNLRQSNGTLNNQTNEEGIPVYRKLSEVEDFSIPTDPVELSEQIENGQIEIGYGQGTFTSGTPYSIQKLDQTDLTSAQGTGYAGKLYFIPKVQQVPSQSTTLPIMLSEETHRMNLSNYEEVQLARNVDGTVNSEVQMSTAEFIYELLTNGVFHNETDQELLGILANTGVKTVVLGLSDVQKHNLNFMVRKQLHMYTDKRTGSRMLITGALRDRTRPQLGYTTRITNLDKITNDQKKQIVYEISQNIHWNTDKEKLLSPISDRIIQTILNVLENNPQLVKDENTRIPFGNPAITFSLKDIGYTFKDGKAIKVAKKTPNLISWMLNNGIIKTDLGNRAFYAPFVYADDIQINDNAKLPVQEARTQVTSQGETISTQQAQPTKPQESKVTQNGKKTPTIAEPATPENLAKYNLQIPSNRSLPSSSHAWCIIEDKNGNKKVTYALKKHIAGLYSTVRGEGKVDKQEAINWLVTNLGIDPSNIEVTNAALTAQSDKEVFGIMLAAVNAISGELTGQIHLSENAGLGIEYHEGFHYVTQLLLSQQQRDALYQDYVLRNPKAKNYTKLEVEEALAEEFRSWMLNEKNPTLGYKVIKFFRNILDFIKAFFGIKNNAYSLNQTLFNAIKSGEFANYTTTNEILQDFVNKHPEGLYYYIPGVTREQLEKMPNITNANTFYQISNILSNAVLTSCNIREKSQLTSDQVNLVFDDIQERLDNGWIEEQYIGIVEDVLNNKEIFRKSIDSKLEQLKVDIQESVEKEESNQQSVDDGDVSDNVWDKNQGEESKKNNVAFNAKLFFYSIPKKQYIFVKNEETGIVEKQLDDALDPIFNLPIPESFGIAWNNILENLWDIDNFDDLVNETKRLGDTDAFFYQIYEMLTSEDRPLAENTKTQLEITIKSSKNRMNTINIHPDRPNIGFMASDEEIEQETAAAMNRSIWEVLDSDNLRKVRRYPSQWSRAFFTSDNVITDENGNRSINKQAYTYITTRRTKINSLIKQIKKNKANLTDGELKLQQMKDAFLQICNAIQIPFDNKALDYLLNSYVDTHLTNISQLNKFISFWEGVYALESDANKQFKKNYQTFNLGILSDINSMFINNKSTITHRSGQGESRSLDRIFNNSSPRAQINQMAVAYGKTHPSPEEFSVTGADGSLIYPISENNYMSDQIRNLNKNRHGKREQLLKTPYSKRSLIANTENQLSLHTFIAMNNQNTSRDYFGITPLEDYIAKLTLTFNNQMILPTMSDKKTWYSISGIKLIKSIISSREIDEAAINYDAIMGVYKDTNEYIIDASRTFDQDALNMFADVWLDEFDAVFDYFVHKRYVAKHPELRRDNYHGKIVNGVMDDSGNGGRFRYFSTINIAGSIKDVNKELARLEKYGSNRDVIKYLQDLKVLLTGRDYPNQPVKLKRGSLIFDMVNNFLIDLTNRELNQLVSKGIVERDPISGRFKNKNIPYNIYSYYKNKLDSKFYGSDMALYEEDIIYSIIGSHVANSAISTIEVEKCFTGDPAYYKWKTFNETESFNDENGNLIESSIKIISGRDVDKIKRLSAVLSTGTNLRTYWGKQASTAENSTKYTILNLKDNNIGSDYHQQLYNIFRNSLIRDLYSEQNPNLTDDELIDATSTKEKEDNIYDNFTEQQKKFIDDNAKASAKPYAYGENEYKDGEINQADAAVYMRPAMYRKIMKALGKWSDVIEEAYNIMEGEDEKWMEDPQIYAKVSAALINPLKMVYFGDTYDSRLNLNIPVFNKMAIFPMFKMLAKADNKLLYDRMNNEELGTIDMVAFESAVKVGGTPKFKFYKNATNTEVDIDGLNRSSYSKIVDGVENLKGQEGDLPVFIQDISNLRLQLNTDPHTHIDRSFGTQAVKILFGNVKDDRSYGNNKNKSVKGSDLKTQSMNAIKALTDKGAFAVLNRFYKEGKINNKALSEYLIDQARTSGMSAEVIQGFMLNSSGEFNIPLAATSSRGWVESRIISYINKEVIDINTPGGSAVQMSSFGFKATGSRKQEAFGYALNNGDKLRFLNDDGSMDIMLSTNFFRHIVPKEFQNSYGQMKKWLVDNNVIGKDSKPIGIGYRIPTQGLSSTFSFKVVDVLPDRIGDTVVVPDEFTAMTGSDFDVDKLYIAMLNLDESGNIIEYDKDENGVELPDIKQSKEAIQNRIITNYQLVVSDNKNMAETRASIDTLTKMLQNEILPLIQPSVKEQALPGYELLPSFQMARKEEYTGGKAGIAPFALNSTNHCLTQFVHLTMKYSHNNIYGLGRLDGIRGRDRYRILDWLSAMINAHVDVAKDPYIMTLNVNQITYNMTNLLLRGGMGKTTFYFLPQPILKEYANKMIANKGVYGVEKKLDKQVVNELYADYMLRMKKAILQLKNTNGASAQAYRNWVKLYNGWCTEIDIPKSDINIRIQDTSILEETSVDHTQIFNDKRLVKSLRDADKQSIYHLYTQLLCMKAYNNLSSDAQILSELVHRSQIDTKKFGNTLADQLNFNNSYNTFKLDNESKFQINEQDVDRSALDVYFKDTFLEKKRYLGTSLPRKLLRTQSFLATKYYQDLFTSTLGVFNGFKTYTQDNGKQLIAYNHVGDKTKIKKLNSALESITRARLTTNLPQFSISDEKFSSMLYGDNTMCKRLSKVKKYILQNKDSLPDLVNQDGTITNAMLNYMQEYAGDGKNQLIDRIVLFNSSMNNDIDTENMLISAFYDLLNSSDSYISQFANDLAEYAYYTSYDNRGVNSFFNLVPNEWKLKNGYVSNIKEALKNFAKDPTSMYEQISEEIDQPDAMSYPSINITIARNMWNDDDIVPLYNLDFGNKQKGDKLLINEIIDNKIVTTAFAIRSYNPSEFIKVRDKRGNVNLYRNVAQAYYTNEEGNVLGYSIRHIYKMVPKLGVLDNGFQVYEFQKGSTEHSAFAINDFSSKMEVTTEQLENVYKKALPFVKKENKDKFTPVFTTIHDESTIKSKLKEDLISMPDSKESIVSAGDVTDNLVSADNDIISPEESFGEEQLAMMDKELSMEFVNIDGLQESIESFADIVQDVVDFGEEFAMQQEFSPETQQNDILQGEDMSELVELGKQRKKECE